MGMFTLLNSLLGMCFLGIIQMTNMSAIYMFLVLLAFSPLSLLCSGATNDHQVECQSSCGKITNISFPFRLKGDPAYCGMEDYELVCDKNRTILMIRDDVYHPEYYVEAINYENYTIRVVDKGIQEGNCSSLPLSNSLSLVAPRRDKNIFVLHIGWTAGPSSGWELTEETRIYSSVPWKSTENMVALLDCENRVVVKSSTSLHYKEATQTSGCRRWKSTDNTHHLYFIFKNTMIQYQDIQKGCSLVASTPFLDFGNDQELSFLDFHNKLAFGYELCWINIHCPNCNQTEECLFDIRTNNAYCQIKPVTDIKPFKDVFYALRVIGGLLAGRTLIGFVCLLLFVFKKYRRRNMSMFEGIEDFLQNNNNLVPIRYSYSQTKHMTEGFMYKIGQGGFGSVYKGKLRNGDIVAIKMLSNSKYNDKDFINEVATIGRIHHANIVRLIGFCAEGTKRALVYDYMPNGSLEKYIFSDQEGKNSLDCSKMFDISVGVARGIEYLHRGCEIQILHFDIKPHNILLDKNFNPRISDFGLAKLYPTDESMATLTAARGTMGYMAPEMFYKNIGRVSYKADVYSFGMLLLEMAGRRKNLNVYADQTSQIYFPSWVYDEFKEGREVEMGETTDDEKKMTKKMIITAFWCTQMKPSDRPSMDRVLEMLEEDIGLLEMPLKPSLNPQEMPSEVI